MNRRTAAALACLLGAFALALPTGAGAGQLEATGWWWLPQQAPGGLRAPASPDVPDGGLVVESIPGQAVAMSALRFGITASETMPILTLDVHSAEGQEVAVIAACPAGSAWEEARAGPWDAKPQAACGEGSVQGVMADDGGSWTFPISALEPLFAPGVIDVVLVPGSLPTPAGQPTQPPFRIVFAAPDADALRTQDREAETTSFDDGGSSMPRSFGGTTTSPDQESATTFTPSLEPDEQEVTSDAPLRAVRAVEVGPVPEEIGGQWFGALVLVMGAAAFLWLAREPMPSPIPLGPLTKRPAASPANVRGIGRFKRERTQPAPRI